jgi:hypothetical protein
VDDHDQLVRMYAARERAYETELTEERRRLLAVTRRLTIIDDSMHLRLKDQSEELLQEKANLTALRQQAERERAARMLAQQRIQETEKELAKFRVERDKKLEAIRRRRVTLVDQGVSPKMPPIAADGLSGVSELQLINTTDDDGEEVEHDAAVMRVIAQSFRGDYLSLAVHEGFCRVMAVEGDEKVVFSDKGEKMASTGTLQPRWIALTDKALYILQLGMVFS